MILNKKLLELSLDINGLCGLIIDTIRQECCDSIRWSGLEDRVQKYIGEAGLQSFVNSALEENLPLAERELRLQVAIQAARKCRAWTLDATEQAFAQSARWAIIRGRLLKYFGLRGIEGKLAEIHEYFLSGGGK